jgi:plasmid maintenance system killer protein
MSDSPKPRAAHLDRKGAGHYSFTMNGQHRIFFALKEDAAYDVEIVDYHDERKGKK